MHNNYNTFIDSRRSYVCLNFIMTFIIIIIFYLFLSSSGTTKMVRFLNLEVTSGCKLDLVSTGWEEGQKLKFPVIFKINKN